MELNREQIIKALECCYENTLSCIDCPYQDKYIECSNLTINALSLIKELTEENERLSEDNYRLHCDIMLDIKDEVIADTIDQTKRATVRKMQERLRVRGFHHHNFGYIVYGDDIDQIAEEIINGN